MQWIVLGSALTGAVRAQTSQQPQKPKADWSVVESLPRGTKISIQQGRHWTHCAFGDANEKALICSFDPQTPLAPVSRLAPPMVFRRENVRKIRLDYTGASTTVGALIGAGAGAILGAIGSANGGTTRGGNALEGGAIGALIGGVSGRVFPFLHGRTIYQR